MYGFVRACASACQTWHSLLSLLRRDHWLMRRVESGSLEQLILQPYPDCCTFIWQLVVIWRHLLKKACCAVNPQQLQTLKVHFLFILSPACSPVKISATEVCILLRRSACTATPLAHAEVQTYLNIRVSPVLRRVSHVCTTHVAQASGK